MAECPNCHQDPGEGSRCEHCGETQYRYAVDEPTSPSSAPPPITPPPPVSDPPADLFDADPLSSGGYTPVPPAPAYTGGETGTGPQLSVPSTPPPTRNAFQEKQAKKGMNGCAIAAIVVGGILVLALVAVFFVGRAVLEDAGGILDNIDFTTGGSQIEWDQVDLGDCINYVDAVESGDGTLVSTLERVDCTELHDAEIYLLAPLDAPSWPGADEAFSTGDDICFDGFAPYVGIDYVDSAYFYEIYTPTEDSWATGDRTIVCTVFDVEGQLAKPLRGSGE